MRNITGSTPRASGGRPGLAMVPLRMAPLRMTKDPRELSPLWKPRCWSLSLHPAYWTRGKNKKKKKKKIVEEPVRHVVHERFSSLQRLKRRFFFHGTPFFETYGNFPRGLFDHILAATWIGALSPLIKPPVGHTLATDGPARTLGNPHPHPRNKPIKKEQGKEGGLYEEPQKGARK